MLTGATAPAGFTQASPSGSTALIDESAFGARGTAHAERLRRSAPIEWPATARCWAALGGRAVLAVGSYAGVVWVWDIRDGSLISGPFADIPEEIYVAGPQLKAQRPPHVTSVAIGRCGGRDVVTTACGGAVQLWDADSGERLPGPDVGNEFIDALALGRIRGRDALVTGSRGGVLRLWDATEARRIAAVTLDALTADFHLHFFDVRSRAVR
jgi:WD40 repeat protein